MLLKGKKEGDKLYVVYNDRVVEPRDEVIESVGRLFIKTRQGAQFSLETGIERKPCKRRDWKPACRAYPSKAFYENTLSHNVRFYKIRRMLSECNPGDFTIEDLELIENTINKAKKG